MIFWVSNQATKLPTVTEATLEMVDAWMSEQTVIPADTETTGRHPHYSKVILLIIGTKELQFVIDTRTVDVKWLLEKHKDKLWIFHNAAFDFKMISVSLGVDLNNLFCTMIAYQIITNGLVRKGYTKKGTLTWKRYSASLATLVKMRFGKELNKNITRTFIDMPDNQDFTLPQVIYGAEDVEYLSPLREQILQRAALEELVPTIDLENRLIPALCRIELTGIDLDQQEWRNMYRQAKQRLQWCELLMDRELRRLGKKNNRFVGGKFSRKRVHSVATQADLFGQDKTIESSNDGNINYGSVKQILDIFRRAGTPIMNGDKETTDEAALHQFLLNRTNPALDKFVNYLLMYRDFEHRIDTYGLGFLQFINKVTGKIHTRYTQTFTDTGRLSSGDMKGDDDKPLKYYVNFQNIPKKSHYRNCFVVPNENYRYITYDLSGAELAILASNSQDPLLLASQNEGLDVHSLLAEGSYRIITGDPHFEVSSTVRPELRQIHKSVTFGIAYGAGAQRIAEILNIDQETAREVLQGIYNKLPKMKAYLDSIKRRARNQLVVIANSRTGRKRYFSAGYADEKIWKVEKEAANMPIQGTNADMIKEAIIEMDEKLKEYDAWMVNTVHDEISVIAHKDIAEEMAQLLADTMVDCANRYLNNVEMRVEGKITMYWTK